MEDTNFQVRTVNFDMHVKHCSDVNFGYQPNFSINLYNITQLAGDTNRKYNRDLKKQCSNHQGKHILLISDIEYFEQRRV